MFNFITKKLGQLAQWLIGSSEATQKQEASRPFMRVVRQGSAMRVIFFYPGEEGTYVDHADVTLYENGIVHIKSNQEETTTHLQNCEILWRFETDADDRANKLRLLKPKVDARASEDFLSAHEPRTEGKPSVIPSEPQQEPEL
ncbi:MAG: hypothetical protein ACO3A2_09090 [Bdellovibrionia bacterium]